MAHPVEATTRQPSGPLPDEWPAHAADSIVRVVDDVRDRTTGPALKTARGVVYGLFAAIVGTVALVLAGILLVRVLNVYIPGEVWIIYLGLGALLTIAGLVLWRKAFAPPPVAS
jgi:hypothetical protein